MPKKCCIARLTAAMHTQQQKPMNMGFPPLLTNFTMSVLRPMAAMVTAVLPLVLLAIFLVRLFIRGKGKLTQDLMPRAKERVGEAIRVRQRKAWERRYGKKEENGGSPT